MKAPRVEISYIDWRRDVDNRLEKIYCITIEDAGLDEDYLTRYWKSNETPSEFVEWFGGKYNLDLKSEFVVFTS